MGELAVSCLRRDFRLGDNIEGASVLVIEDEAMVRAAIKLALTSWGCRVLECTSVAKVERALQTQSFLPNIILADLHLGRHGEPTAADLLPGFLSRTGLSGVPVILLSGDSAPGCRSLARDQGWGFLLKPFTSATLREAIASGLQQAAATASRHRAGTTIQTSDPADLASVAGEVCCAPV